MIVRIMAEGQYRLPDSALRDLNDLDNKLVEATAKGDAAEFHRLLGQMHQLVKRDGQPVPPDELVGSDVVLPPADTTFDEASNVFVGEGLIPG